jgi:DNA-binding HxlR family transcriptional regulator
VPGRSYGPYCPVARTLELVGERWTLLIVRELILGPMRFTDLHGALPGIPRNLLADRLRTLEAHGLLARRVLPPPAARTVYELTEAGRDLTPVVAGLARWGLAHLDPPAGDEEVSPVMAVLAGLAAHTVVEPEMTGEETFRLEVDGRAFTLRLAGGGLSFDAAGAEPDVVVATSAAVLLRLRIGSETLSQARADGRIRFTPDDPRTVRRFADRFAIPVPAARPRKERT